MSLVQVATETVTSAVASVTLTGIDSDDVYMLAMNNVQPVNDSGYLLMRVTESGTANTTSNYDSAMKNLRADTSFSNSNTGQVMAAQSDLYNTFNPDRADEGDDRYFPLGAGNYLICVSAERNEEFQYGVGLVVEFQTPNDELFFLCEDSKDITYLVTENDLNDAVVETVPNTVTSGITLSSLNGFTENLCTIVDPGGVVQVNYQNIDGNNLSWLIGPNPET